MITTPARYAPPWPAIAAFLVGLAGVAGSITVVFLGMRSVLDVGGQCASGGPFEIAVPCPDGTWTLPLAIFAGLGFVFLAVTGGTRIGGLYAALPGLAWVGLFCSLGFNFLQWGIAPPADLSGEATGGGLVFVGLGLMFEVMGIVPLVTSLVALRPGAKGRLTLGGGISSMSDLPQGLDGLRSTDSPSTDAIFQPFQATEGGKAVDMNELLSEVAKTVAEARARGIIGPMAITQAGVANLGGLTAASGGAGGTDLVAELERLTALHQAGNLTDEEFTAAKQNLIKAQS